MPKSLGQIHTVSYEFPNLTYFLASTNELLIDLPGQLTLHLQHMVRAMSSFKVVGIDMTYGPIPNATDITCSMSGQIKYYAPTQGRVAALKGAYVAVRRMMKLSGVNPNDNLNYDFRPPIADPASFENGADFYQQACIEDNGMPSCLSNGPGSSNVFGMYNQQIGPRYAIGGGIGVEEGFDIGLRDPALAGADWVLNEGAYLQSAGAPTAIEEYEVIPFELSYSAPDTVAGITMISQSDSFNWRPDPALYLSILTGQLIVEIESSTALDDAGNPAANSTQLDVAVHVAGWKSILGSKKKKSRRSKKGKKSHGRKRRSKR